MTYGHAEDRENELAALESIYEDKLTITENDGLQKFKVSLEGHCGGADDDWEVSCSLLFEYTEDYPHGKPQCIICDTKSLPNTEISVINEVIDNVIQRSLGYIMIFDILSEVQEKLNSICEQRLKAKIKEAEFREKAKLMEEEVKFRGDRVTIASFNAWNAKFLAELSAAKDKKTTDDVKLKGLTGRELFLRDSRYDDSDLNFLDGDEETVEIDESLFANIDDIDLTEEQ